MLRVAATVAGVALALAPAAFAGPTYVEVLSPSGDVLAAGGGARFDYPADGALVHIGAATADAGGATLTDVALAGNLVNVSEIDLLADGRVVLGSTAAAGRLVMPRPNTLVPLGALGYVMLDQRARAKGRVGRVAVRLVVQRDAFGVPAGTEVLLRFATGEARTAPRFNPLAVLGFAGSDAKLIGFVPAPSAVSESIGERAVALASQFLGVRYVWGGADPLVGFDCSGLVMYVYGQLGIRLTHYTGAQFREGLQLPRDQLQPGDLVFFDEDPVRGPQHEGIYIGDGRFIQAPHTGDVVKISSLDDARYGFSFVGAVRPYAG